MRCVSKFDAVIGNCLIDACRYYGGLAGGVGKGLSTHIFIVACGRYLRPTMSDQNAPKGGVDGLEAFLGESVNVNVTLNPSQSILAIVRKYNGKRHFKGKGDKGDYDKLSFTVYVVQDNMNVYTGLEGDILLSTSLYPQIRKALQNHETCWKITRGRITELTSFPEEFCHSKLGQGGQA